MGTETEEKWRPRDGTSVCARQCRGFLPARDQPKSQFEFVPQDTEKSEFLDLADLGGVAISVESVIRRLSLFREREREREKERERKVVTGNRDLLRHPLSLESESQ